MSLGDPRRLLPLALILQGCGTTDVAPPAAEPQVIVMGAYLAAKGHSGDNVELVVMGLSQQMPTSRTMAGLTLSIVNSPSEMQGSERTKVKLRFDKVYYPVLLEAYYKVVWQAVDKQMFLDKGLD